MSVFERTRCGTEHFSALLVLRDQASQLYQRPSSAGLINRPLSLLLPLSSPWTAFTFHLSRKALDEFPNRAEAHARRGAAWTFDAHGVVNQIRVLHKSSKTVSEPIFAPSFDHILGDPLENAITIAQESSIIILEGHWLLFDE